MRGAMDAMEMWDSEDLGDVERYLESLIADLPAAEESDRSGGSCTFPAPVRCRCGVVPSNRVAAIGRRREGLL
jgi:hypothetical protein